MNEKLIELVKDILLQRISNEMLIGDGFLELYNAAFDNIYTLGVSDGMNRAFEAMRRDVKLPEEK